MKVISTIILQSHLILYNRYRITDFTNKTKIIRCCFNAVNVRRTRAKSSKISVFMLGIQYDQILTFVFKYYTFFRQHAYDAHVNTVRIENNGIYNIFVEKRHIHCFELWIFLFFSFPIDVFSSLKFVIYYIHRFRQIYLCLYYCLRTPPSYNYIVFKLIFKTD